MFFATVARVGVFCAGYEPVFSASVPRCFLRRPWVFIALHGNRCFFATVVFSALVSGVFCHGNRGILRQLEGGLNANTRLLGGSFLLIELACNLQLGYKLGVTAL